MLFWIVICPSGDTEYAQSMRIQSQYIENLMQYENNQISGEIREWLTSTAELIDFDTSQLRIKIETNEYSFVSSLYGYLDVELLSSSNTSRINV